ncbi:MAG TPA: carboxypeptidase-like regulatory domain-containing protein, partial [Flavitalea sp.]|nr:carboxypeptidase-like regulatory domain-containing protein [Flavitalea sp.]
MTQTFTLRLSMVALLLTAFSISGLTQFTLQGTVKDTKKQPIDGASIALKSTYYGTSSAADGSFSFSFPDTGRKILLITMMGFKPFEKEIIITRPITEMEIILKEEIIESKAVVITAGSFEAGDKKRATVLKSVDIVTTAGNQADLVSALKTLPGAQHVGEEEGLFVRGGTGAETKVFIDGMMVQNPFFSSVPDIAQRGRFSPLLFKGTNFSSGGYSAQYGQALSSALILETHDLPSRSEINAIISSPQLSLMGQHLNKEKNASVGMNVTYSNLKYYFDVVPQKIAYSKAPEILNTELFARRKVKGGLFKFYAYANTNEVGFEKQNIDKPTINDHFQLKNTNFFSTVVYAGKISDHWNLSAGASVSANKDNIEIISGTKDSIWKSFAPQIGNRLVQSKVTFARYFSGLTKLYFGAEVQRVEDKIFASDSIPHIHLRDNYVAAYSEADIYYSARLVQRIGMRLENSSL